MNDTFHHHDIILKINDLLDQIEQVIEKKDHDITLSRNHFCTMMQLKIQSLLNDINGQRHELL